jgi:hypothetical protein
MKSSQRVRGKLRIRYEKQGDILVSKQLFSDGTTKMVKVFLYPDDMLWQIVDAVTGHVYLNGGENINNFEVLQRSAKKALDKLLKLNLEKEKRNVRS